MDERQAVEGVVREYLQRRDSPADLATGKLETFMLVPQALSDELEASHSIVFSELAVREIQGDVALVDLDARLEDTVTHPRFGRLTSNHHLGGPVLLHRVDDSWKVADYVLNGRRRSESIVIDPSGVQEAEGVALSVRAVDLQGSSTAVYLALTNGREFVVEWDWAALGAPRRESWRFEEMQLSAPELPAGGPHIVGAFGPPVPLGTRELRLILVEKGRKATFDLVVRLNSSRHELADVQRAPDSLPLRFRLRRSPLALLGLLPLAAVILLLGGLRSLGLALTALGLFIAGASLWNRSRGRPVLLVRALVVAAVLLASGIVMLSAAGFGS